MLDAPGLSLSKERFVVRYGLSAESRALALQMAESLCVEQTIEFPLDLIAAGPIREQVLGQVVDLEAVGDEEYVAGIAYAIETAGEELTQLLNVVFGNSGLKPGIVVEELKLPEAMLARYAGPRFGVEGLRRLVGAPGRPLLCTAIKPMGLSAQRLATMAKQMALGGVDLIKDDHGLVDQSFCPFDERVARVAEAVAEANAVTGHNTLYVANVTADATCRAARWQFARDHGAGALMLAPGLTGFDVLRQLAADEALDLPILAHPAWLGPSLERAGGGVAHGLLLGSLMRLAGADATIFPNYGGRFSFSPEQCRAIVAGCREPMGQLAPIFPVPAGGMRLDRVEELRAFYGDETMLLIGGDLHREGDLRRACARFVDLVS